MRRSQPATLFRILPLAALLVLCACGGRTPGGPYFVPPDADLGELDAGMAPTCPSEQYLRLVPVPLFDAYLLDPPSLAAGQTMRVAAVVEIAPCERLAQVVVADQDAVQRVVTLQAYVWREIGVSCDGPLSYAEELIEVTTMTHGIWSLLDSRALDAALDPSFTVVGCWAADCECYNSGPGDVADGGYCDYDCQCAPELRCLSRPAGVGGRECARSCSVDGQCDPWQYCSLVDGDIYGHCTDRLAGDCVPGECDDGYVCNDDGEAPNHCEADQDTDRQGFPCVCHADCGPGLQCTQLGTNAAQACRIPCRGDADCPATQRCGADDPAQPPVCVTL